MTSRPARLLLTVAAVVALGSACSSASSSSADATPSAGTSSLAASPSAAATPASTAAAAPALITIRDFTYTVPPSVAAGVTVTVQNQDSEAHTVTLGGGSSAKVVVQAGGSGKLVAPSRPGHYPITCDYHGNMHSTLVVA